jgi:hypothetical protein
MTDVFISYAREQRSLAEHLAEGLKAHRYDVWWDARLSAGQLFDDKIREQIDAAKALAVIWSSEAAASPYVLMEVGIAFAWSKKLIPVRVPYFPDSQIPEPFKKHQAIELTDAEAVLKSLKDNKIFPPAILEQALRKLEVHAPGARRELESWIAKCPGFYLKGHDEQLSITIRSAVGPGAADVNFGTIDTDDSTFYAGDFCNQKIAKNNVEIAKKYISGLASLVENAYVTFNPAGQPTNIRMPGLPSYPSLRNRIMKGDDWCLLLQKARDGLGRSDRG